MLFMVRNKVGMMYGKDDCFEVMRICYDLDIIAMFHDHDAIVTPNKAKFMPSFPKMEKKSSADESSWNMSDKSLGLSESSSLERGNRRLRRKLVIDFESEDEDVNDVEEAAAQIKGKKHVADTEFDLNDEPKETNAETETKDVVGTESLVADGGKVVSIDGTPKAVETKEFKSGFTLSEAITGKKFIDFAVEDDELDGIVSADESTEDSDSSEGEDMVDNLDECGLKYKVKIEPVDDDNDKVLNKGVYGDEVIVISDDDEVAP
ncbi:uncharacterized protein LOC130733902 isoform X2 [Lotus japonicus]|nr:uncharacterized protein LOC130733902 isoform X2 [Lotus japonicus]XP_057442169.1 uncharacterized protein LOC130733902 isoform X2 [Lotus japonicus]XP_057442170.1 uncharacterized protein LOC130733902 isoform X2 [Lotus japonicus]XP_057442171.1 uncharacterized protein LOC130733902 isoform X2 [Lotus japonicus]XP_057442172.1 uncharacterized protein LOC130733902 isoform X2 [Lotus japonicus]XP_057442173.1 uncharacterized protein LOC130733902 isoform X2 [Lotus japonicus]